MIKKNQVKQTNISEILKDICNKKIEEIKNPSIFEEIPVPPKEFFEKWMKSPLFPIQQKAIDEFLVEFGNDNKKTESKETSNPIENTNSSIIPTTEIK